MDTGCLLGTLVMERTVVTVELKAVLKIEIRRHHTQTFISSVYHNTLLEYEWKQKHKGTQMEELAYKNMRDQGETEHPAPSVKTLETLTLP